MPKEDPVEIDCKIHGKGVAAVVCGHLADNNVPPLGFIENCSVSGDLQGWCYGCEYVFQQEGEMTETFRSYIKMTMVCENCYEIIKAKHGIIA